MTKKVSKVEGFTYTTAIKKLRRLKKRIKKIQGGTSAGKTYGILPILIDKAIKTPLLEISVVSESVPHLRKGALKDFLKIMKRTGRYVDAHYHRTFLTYQFSNGSYIEFFSADQEDKVRGPRRNILYINECNNINFDTYYQLAIRTDMEVWLDYNPTHEFWANTELKDDPDLDEIILTYKDNEGLSHSIVKEIEKARTKAFNDPYLNVDVLFNDRNIKSSFWSNWWKVYGMGLTGSLEGVIYDNWSIIDRLPEEARLLGYGLDFGFSKDPASLVAAYRLNGRIIFDELLYQTGLTNPQLIKMLSSLGVDPNMNIWADSAEPKTIKEIKMSGYNIRAVEKGADSIRSGVKMIQGLDHFHVTKRSVNGIKELRGYVWDTDKSGNSLNKPIDLNNHFCDAKRYWAMMELKAQSDYWVV